MKKINLLRALLYLPFIGMGVACNNEAGNENSEAYEATEEWKDKRAGKTGYDVEKHRKFAMEAASDGMMEIRLSEMAIEKASNEQVKELAQMIRTDHQSANAKLKEIMQINGWNIPTRMMEKHDEQVKELRNISEQEFDQKYLSMMVEDHKKAIDKFERTANNAAEDNQKATGNNTTGNQAMADDKDGNRQLRTWINETLPVLRKHLERSKELQGQLGS